MINLYNEDCLEKMKDIPDKTIDMILCDLPYGTTACKWDTVIDFNLLWEQYKRIIKDNAAIVLFGSQPFTSKLVCSNIKWFRYEWIWQKEKGANFGNVKYHPLKYHENIIVFSKKAHKYKPQMEKREEKNKRKNKPRLLNARVQFGKPFIAYNKTSNRNYKYPSSIQKYTSVRKAIHPTQKPVPLLEYLIKTYTDPKEIILDNCMGSGSTGIACINLKRKFIGIEKNKDIYETALKRIEEHKTQLPLKI
tara:strand:+ start:290 stop:1036 length:747 start_codon:yes stop_codon:yes gene_type:complete